MQLTPPDVNDILAAQSGDARALRSVARRALPMVLEWTTRLGGPAVDAEDAAHDVLLVVCTRLSTLADPRRFDSWLFGVTRRVLARHRRRAWVRRRVPWMFQEAADEGPNPQERVELSDLSRRIQEVMECLSADHREILVLSDVEERSEREVADLLRLPIGTVRSRVYRARKAFLAAAERHHLPILAWEDRRGHVGEDLG